MSVCTMASRTVSGTADMFTPGRAWIVPCNKPAAKVRALTYIFPLLCRIFLASSDHQLLFILLILLTLFCVPVVVFSLLSTDTVIPEDFDDLRVLWQVTVAFACDESSLSRLSTHSS